MTRRTHSHGPSKRRAIAASISRRTSSIVDPPGLTPAAEQQRAALALGNGRVCVGYGGLAGDCGPYRGAVDSVTEDGGTPVSFIVPTTREGGIWGPSGPAISSNGDVYVSVGNGAQTNSSQPFDGSDSVNQLSPTLVLKSRFAPAGWAADNASDLDLGSTGPELLQNGELFQVGKRGTAYLLTASDLGGVGGQVGSSPVCTSFGGQAYAPPTIYVSCTDGVRAVKLNAQNNGFDVIWHGPITVTGLTNGDSYTLSVVAANAKGAGPASGPSNAVVPSPSTAQPVVSSPQFGVPSQTDVFRVAGNGAVEVFWVDSSGTFHGPLAVSAPGLAPPGAHLAVSQQFGIPDQTDVFVVADNGATQVLWVDGAGRWGGPLAISAPSVAHRARR